MVYLTHRDQFVGSPTSQQTPMRLRGGSSPARDTVEVLTFLRSASTVRAVVGGKTYEYQAPAGVSAKTFPLAVGNPSASVTRNGATVAEVRSPFTVGNSVGPQQNLAYYGVSSGR